MGYVRPLEERDLPAVVGLYERVLGKCDAAGRDRLRGRLSRIFVEHPWHDARMPSFVFEEAHNGIVGCLGVLPRPMHFNGRSIAAAICHSFIVEPYCRSSLAAMHLAREFLAGPQELALAEGNDVSRRLWEGVGGMTSLVHSLAWTRMLKPARYALAFLRRRGMSATAGALLQPWCRLADAVVPLFVRHPFRAPPPATAGNDADPAGLLEALTELARARRLRPAYSADAFAWLLDTVSEVAGRGGLRKALVEEQGAVVGAYIYYLKPDGVAEVVQIACIDGAADAVLDRLFHDAAKAGAVAVSGQMDPALFRPLAERHCIFHHNGSSWMLLHARDPAILETINGGQAFLTRMEGEWWISSFLG